MTAAQALVALHDNPEQFLRQNILLIAGGANAAAHGTATFAMSVRSSGGFMAQKLSAEAAQGRPNLFEAYYVPMQQLGNFQANALPTAAESPLRLMLTSQITACLFAVGVVGGRTQVAHIQPDRTAHTHLPEAQGQAFRQSDMRMSARVRGLRTFAAQGVDYDRLQNEAVTIVGLRDDRTDRWQIIRQKWNSGNNTILDVTVQ